MPHSGAAISENPAGMSPPLTTIKRERNSLEELINFGLWKAGRRTRGRRGAAHMLLACWSFYGQNLRMEREGDISVIWLELLQFTVLSTLTMTCLTH